MFSELNNELGVANVDYRYGVLYRFIGEYEEALVYANRYLDYVNEANDTLGKANIYYQLGVIYSLSGDYESSLKEYYNCLEVYEAMDDPSSRGFTLNSIGIVYKNLNKHKEAEEAYLEAIGLLEPIDDKNNLADVYHSLGSLYAMQGKLDEALDYFFKTLDIGIELDREWGIAKNYNSIGIVYMDQGKMEEAIDYMTNAKNIYEENNYEEDLNEVLMNLAQAYSKKGDLNKSEEHLLLALDRNPESLQNLRNIHFELYQLYSEKGEAKKALHHHEEYSSVKDSIYQMENIESINDLQLKYETEKKDKALAENELIIEQGQVAYLKKRNQLYLALSSGVLLLILAISLYLVFRERQLTKNQEIENLKAQKEVTKLESLIEGEEKERKRMALDLHDGINGDLSVIKYKIDAIEQSKLDHQEQKEINEAVGMLDNAIQQVRNISHNLAPPSLKNFSLTEAVKQFCHSLSNSSNVNVDFQSFGNPVMLNKEHETAIYRMIQELLNNVVKHAESSEALVQINHHPDSMDITVEDNGKGYDTKLNHNGIGLKNINSRASMLQTECIVESDDKGTTANIHIDLSKLNYD